LRDEKTVQQGKGPAQKKADSARPNVSSKEVIVRKLCQKIGCFRGKKNQFSVKERGAIIKVEGCLDLVEKDVNEGGKKNKFATRRGKAYEG